MRKRLELARLYWRRVRVEGVWRSLRRIAGQPSLLLRHARRIAAGDARPTSNPYGAASSRAVDVRLVAAALKVGRDVAEEAIREIEADAEFLAELRDRYRRTRPETASAFELGRFRIVYALVRLSGAQSVIETGVHDGLTTALILRALERNGAGHLTSIDLPSTDLPIGARGPGWLIPERLKARWTLCLGDSRRLLPEAAAANAPIDLFLHDSDHSRTHREFEFRAVRAHVAPSGLIASDDDEPPDTLLDELGREWSMVHMTNAVEGTPGPAIGLLVP